MSARKKQVRAAFRDAVFARDNHQCILCHAPAVDAHHIISRKAFPDGGYFPDNGVSLCTTCHIKAEAGEVTPGQLREQAGIRWAGGSK